jgi:WD40 repeat protein
VLAAILGEISYLGVGLQTCEWLDVALKRSGCLRSLQVDRESIEDVAFSPDGRLLAVASSEATIQMYRVDDGSLLQTLRGHSNWVTSVAFSPDGALIASGSWDGTVRFWDSVTGTLNRTLSVPVTPGNATIQVAFSPNGTLLASAAYKTPAHLWRVSDGSLLRTIPNTGESVAFSPDGSMVATEGLSNTIVLSRIADGSTVAILGGQDFYVRNLAFSPDGAIVASGGGDAIRLWRVSDGTLIQTFSTQADWDLAFSPDGQFIVSGGTNDDIQNRRGYIELWRVATGQRVSQWDAGRFSIHDVAISPTGKTIASGSGFQTVRLWSP